MMELSSRDPQGRVLVIEPLVVTQELGRFLLENFRAKILTQWEAVSMQCLICVFTFSLTFSLVARGATRRSWVHG